MKKSNPALHACTLRSQGLILERFPNEQSTLDLHSSESASLATRPSSHNYDLIRSGKRGGLCGLETSHRSGAPYEVHADPPYVGTRSVAQAKEYRDDFGLYGLAFSPLFRKRDSADALR